MPVVWLDPIRAIILEGGPLACEIIGTCSRLGEVSVYSKLSGPGGTVVYLATILSACHFVGEWPSW